MMLYRLALYIAMYLSGSVKLFKYTLKIEKEIISFRNFCSYGFSFKSNERSEDSYIGLVDSFFFQEKVLKFVHAQF